MALYVASDRVIVTRPQEAKHPGLYIRTPGWRAEGVRKQFSKAHVVYLGAYAGCACGFGGSDENDRGKESLDSLRAFLEEQLERVEELELFACWMGDETDHPESHLNVSPDYFQGEAFSLPASVFFRVRRAADPADAPDEAPS